MKTGTAQSPAGSQSLARGMAAISAAVITVVATTLIGRTIWSALALPSVTSIALILDLALRPFRMRLFTIDDRGLILRVVAAIAIPLYATTLAYLPGDLYRVGFSPWCAALLALAAAIIAPRRPRPAILVLLILISFDLRLLPSLNLFDYCVDPIIGLVALGWLGRQIVVVMIGAFRSSRRRTTDRAEAVPEP